MHTHDKIYVGGQWIASEGSGTIQVYNSATEEVIGSIPDGAQADVDKAVAAARAAFDSWADTSPQERAKYVQRLSEGLGARMMEIGDIVMQEVGMPSSLAAMVQAGLPVAVTGSYVEIAESFPWEEELGDSRIYREPVGVVGAITPWNYPLHQVMAKVAPALVAGCTVVLKPSEVAPLSAFILAEVVDEIGLPDGVFNLVSGTGPVVGEAIARHPDVDMISFTGSTRAGKHVAAVAAETAKKVALEMGGKSAFIVLDDTQDLEEAVRAGIGSCYLNGGQTCIAWTRMLVPNDKVDEAAGYAKAVAEGYKVGDPAEADTTLGPLASQAQQERVRTYIQKGLDEGAQLVTGGPEMPEGLDRGYYIRPTVFAHVTNDMAIAQEEIFGPVLSIIGYDDEDDAVRIANDTIYGLHGGVWSDDPQRALGVARRLRTGQVDINGSKFNQMAPFGGYKQSGLGRELGRFGLEEYLEIKSVQL